VCGALPATRSQWLCKSLCYAACFFCFSLNYCWMKCQCRHALYVFFFFCFNSILSLSFQSPQRRLLHAGGKETEAQGWCFGKMLCGSTLHWKSITERHTLTPLRFSTYSAGATWLDTQRAENYSRTHISSLACNCMCTVSLCRIKIYVVSRTVLYNLCYLLHNLSPREHCIQGLMMSAKLYKIKRMIGPSPNNEMRFI